MEGSVIIEARRGSWSVQSGQTKGDNRTFFRLLCMHSVDSFIIHDIVIHPLVPSWLVVCQWYVVEYSSHQVAVFQGVYKAAKCCCTVDLVGSVAMEHVWIILSRD